MALLCSFACTPVSIVQAVDSDIGVNVCGGTVAAAQIDITQPVSDSIIAQPNATFRAIVANATQVEVSVDGNYTQTIAIGANDSEVSAELTVTEGTHTITMTANGICGSQNAEDSVVITYQPESQPSGGAVTPTQVGDDLIPVNGVIVGDEQTIKNDEVAQSIQDIPLFGGIVKLVAAFSQETGLTSTVTSSNTVIGVSRVGLTVAALTTVVMASSLAPLAAQAIPGVSEVFNVSSHRSMIYLGWVIRGAGVLAMAFAFLL